MIRFLQRPILFLRDRFSEKNFFILSSILVGITSGLAAVVLKYFVHKIGVLVTYSRQIETFFIFAIIPLAGILLTVLFVRYVLQNSLKKGSAEITYWIIKKSAFIPANNIFGHLLTSAMTVGFGGSLGLESPMVSIGSAIGSNYGRTYGLSYKERTMLIGCGAAAGIAAAFNAPIAGVLFVVEVLLVNVSVSAFIPLIISAACGALLSKIMLAEGITLAFSLQKPFNYNNVPFYILLGIFCGLTSICYARIFHGVESKIAQVKNIWHKAIVGGILLFIILIFFPPLFGEGYESVKLLEGKNALALIDGSILAPLINSETILLIFIFALIFFKMIAAAITLGSGGNGGSFAPSLVIGSFLGFLFSRLINTLRVIQLPISNFTLVGMAGILSGVFYAPLTGIFLIAEITGGYNLMIPLMIVSSLSLLVAHLFEPLSMEGKKLSIMLRSTVESRDKLVLSKIDLADLVESNFSSVPVDAKLSDLVKVIATSKRNLFPVIDSKNELVGLIHLDQVRSVMFDRVNHDVMTVKDLMEKPKVIVDINEGLHGVLAKFDQSNQWNLPVVDNGIYLGFLSKSSILSRYRKELIEFS